MNESLPSVPLLPQAQLEAVVTSFYDMVFAHPWIGQFFTHVDQRNQETKLVRFFQMSWDDRAYPDMQAQYIRQEHAHMYITDELFELRSALFSDAVRKHGHGQDVVEAFEVFNDIWRASVIKASVEDCSDMFTDIVVHPRPEGLGAVSAAAGE
ncbi:MAG: hypothetical protein KDK70_12335 [Myxococcales bacterium]|nr:hypothetical protein [Myxococcales bacterium]